MNTIIEKKLQDVICVWTFVHGQGSSGICGGSMDHVQKILDKSYYRDVKLNYLLDESFDKEILREDLFEGLKNRAKIYFTQIHHNMKFNDSTNYIEYYDYSNNKIPHIKDEEIYKCADIIIEKVFQI